MISPAESARRRWLFLSVGFRHEAAAKLRNSSIFRFFTQGGNIGQRGHRGGPTGIQEGAWRALGGAATGTLLDPWWVPSGPLFGSSSDSPKYLLMSNFIEFGGDLIEQLEVHFSPLNLASAASAPESCKLCKTSQNNIRTIL